MDHIQTNIHVPDKQPIHFTLPPADTVSSTQIPVARSNEFTTPQTPLPTTTATTTVQQQTTAKPVDSQIKTNIPVSNDNLKGMDNRFQSQQQQEQTQPIPERIPSFTSTQQTISTTTQQSLSDVPTSISPRFTEASTIPTTTMSTESHIPVTTPKIPVHPRHIPETTESPVKTATNPTESTDQRTFPTVSSSTTDQRRQVVNNIDLPRHVRIHRTSKLLNQQAAVNALPSMEASTEDEDEPNITTDDSTKVHTSTNNETKIDHGNHSSMLNVSIVSNSTGKNRQICWRLPKRVEPSIELLENQIFGFVNILPEFVQTIFLDRIEDREVLMNTMWFGSVCTMCGLFSFLFLSMGTRRLKQSKSEKEIRARCQQLQQYNNQLELERATFEKQNQKLTDEIEELKNIPVRDSDEDLFALRDECFRFQEDLQTVRADRDTLKQNIEQKQNLIQKHEFEMQRQVEAVAYLNNEILQLKRDLEKERATISKYQSNDISLERFEKSQELIQELKSENAKLKEEKFTHKDQLQEIQDQVNKLDLENNQLILRMKQLKDLLEERDQTIKHIQERINEEEFEDLRSLIANSSSNRDQRLLSTVDNDLEKSNQHMRDLQHEIEEKTSRIKELDSLLKQEGDRAKEMETKLKVVLELRERDAHLHIRQLGQTDAELRKARNDTERVRILQQQLDLKQQQLDDVQKVLTSEQMKFNEECSKLQHDTHEKWMEVKRLTRELDISKKECEGLRKQITKYASSTQEKTMIKPVPQHYGNNAELETNSNSPNSFTQGENFRPIDHQRNESGATSPTEMFMPRPPMFGLPRPPFFPTPFMPVPPPNTFMMHPRFPMPAASPHGMISPVSHLLINSNDMSNSENIDSSNITPNSTGYERQSNGGVLSPVPENGKQTKTKKTKKSSKKKGETSLVKENV
ncbi:unnamed protein product [Adineta ricciae]|uniref:Uncharacterized protein n=1 Tax=Adineta ricciae TaxID=249248 RepID=A0A813YP07_ADIRI|nr:unnamed protein product [Adineta ricciae]CAF1410063.1 unnamed protein product [Adineta ricciae]